MHFSHWEYAIIYVQFLLVTACCFENDAQSRPSPGFVQNNPIRLISIKCLYGFTQTYWRDSPPQMTSNFLNTTSITDSQFQQDCWKRVFLASEKGQYRSPIKNQFPAHTPKNVTCPLMSVPLFYINYLQRRLWSSLQRAWNMDLPLHLNCTWNITRTHSGVSF